MAHTFHHGDFPTGLVLDAKARTGRSVSVCIPARDEGSTVGSVVRAVVQPFLLAHGGNGLVDEVIVLDDGSLDDTADQAHDAGARVVAGPGGPGARARPWPPPSPPPRATSWSSSTPTWPTPRPPSSPACSVPLLTTDHVALVKGFYTRPLHGEPTGGGRVTELVARPVLELLFPELSWVRQPLAGETAAHRWVFEKLGFADGYGVELGLLIDVAQSLGADRLAQVDLGERIHRNRPARRAAPAGGRRPAGRPRTGLAHRAAPPLLSRPCDPAMSATVVVSNRGPLTFRAEARRPAHRRQPAGGGLASSLHGLLAGTGTTWASVTMGAADREAVAQGRMHEEGLDLVPVVVDDDTYRMAYDVVANSTLWYCHHHMWDLPLRPRFDRHWRAAWEGYRGYNAAMADAVAARADEGAAVLVQDYHFSLLGRMLAERRPDLRTVHFLHTPFADPSILGVLPDDVRVELLDGMAGYERLRLPLPRVGGRLPVLLTPRPDWRRRATFVAPLGPDAGVLEAEAAAPPCAAAAEALRARDGRAAHDRALRPSGAVEEHRAGDARLRGAAADPPRVARRRWSTWRSPTRAARAWPSISPTGPRWSTRRNGSTMRHGTATWTPILLSVRDDCARSLAALSISDVLLVNPVRDGLNLVAKEGPLLNRAGRLVLSAEAGAYEELAGAGALGVNPFDVSGTAEALHRALCMAADERARRASDAADGGAGAHLGPVVGRPVGRRGRADVKATRRRRRRRPRPGRRSRATAPAAPGTVSRPARPPPAGSRRRRRPRAPRRPDAVGVPSSPTASKAGRSPMSSPKAATWRSRPACSAARACTTVPLSTAAAGAARAPCGPDAHAARARPAGGPRRPRPSPGRSARGASAG